MLLGVGSQGMYSMYKTVWKTRHKKCQASEKSFNVRSEAGRIILF